jgi:hypothetical protein
MRISDGQVYNDGDYLYLSQNAWQDETTLLWSRTDTSKDAYFIEFFNNTAEEGYISIKRAPAGTGNITWTEMFRFNFDGTFIMHSSLISPPTAPGADQAKVYLDDYLGRLQSFMKTASETVSLVQGVNTNRIWLQDGFPGTAKKGDLLIKPASLRGLRFGEIWVEGNAVATSIALANTWYQITSFDTNGAANDTVPDHTNDHITINHTGLYHVVASTCMVSQGASPYTVDVAVHKNNGATKYDNLHFSRALSGAGGDVGSGSISGLAIFEENDTVELWIQNTTNTNNVIIQDCNLTIVELQPAR